MLPSANTFPTGSELMVGEDVVLTVDVTFISTVVGGCFALLDESFDVMCRTSNDVIRRTHSSFTDKSVRHNISVQTKYMLTR